MALAVCCLGAQAIAGDVGSGLQSARDFKPHHLYFAGDTALGDPLTDVERFSSRGGPVWSFFYGDCDPSPEAGCLPQAEIQNWSICERYPSGFSQPPRLKPFHGAMAGWLRTALSFEVYTGKTAVAVFWGTRPDPRTRAKAKAIAKTLIDVRPSRRSDRLPSVSDRALTGRLPCQR